MSRYSCPELPVWVSPQAVVAVASALPVPPGAADKSQALLISLLFYPWVLWEEGLRAEMGSPYHHPQLQQDPGCHLLAPDWQWGHF